MSTPLASQGKVEKELEPHPTLLRSATLTDATAIATIFNEEVLNGHATYETVPHTAEQRRDWLSLLEAKGLAAFVAERDGQILGFAALTPFHPAAGYRFTVSAQIYLTHGSRGRGIGTTLVRALYDQAIDKGFHCVLAGVNSRNAACQALLRRMGFKTVGHFREIGFKNGQWWDDTCLQLILPSSPHKGTNQ